MSARLTNGKRDSIVEQESKLKFHEKGLKLENEFRTELQKIAEKTVPKCITQEVKDSGYIRNTSSVSKIDGEDLPRRLKRKYQLKSLFNPIPHTGSWSDVKLESTMKLRKTLVKIEKHEEEIKKFETNLTQVLYSYTNSKKLLEAVPELKNHFGSEVTSTAAIPLSQIKNVRAELTNPRPTA